MTKIKKLNKKLLIIGVLALLIFAGGLALYLSNRTNNSEQVETNPTAQEEINLSPPTEEDIKEAETHKEQLAQASGNPALPANGKVTPVITSWGQANEKVEVAARVPGVLEEGGTCTLTLKKDSVARSATSQAIANVSEVSCGFIAISRSTLTAGEWSATVSYSSPKANGVSEAKSITVK